MADETRIQYLAPVISTLVTFAFLYFNATYTIVRIDQLKAVCAQQGR
jgi:hypothetical protein